MEQNKQLKMTCLIVSMETHITQQTGQNVSTAKNTSMGPMSHIERHPGPW
jgi:hypothetical protein